jgi:error-prone DNA polymerase
MSARLLQVHGRLQKSPDGVVHVMAEHLVDRSEELARLSSDSPSRAEPLRAGEPACPVPRRHPRDVRVLPQSRDFH